MLCRIYVPGKIVISYKANVKEMFFIRQGLIDVYNNESDDIEVNKDNRGRSTKQKPILHLPKYSYFGDF